MGESPRRVLLADTTPDNRAVLEPLIKSEGWELLSVESSFQVLRTVRDANVDLVLINPDLPGSGVTGADVAKTLKGATQFRHLPVLFLLHGERAAPPGIPADGSIVVDRWAPARIVQTLRQALGLTEPGKAEPWTESPDLPEGPADRALPPSESVVRALTDLMERLTARLETQLSDLLAAQESRLHEETSRRLAVAAQEFFLKEGPAAIREEIRDQVRDAVERAVREVAREVVPEVAERLIADELARLRRQYDVE
jgi:CheY-like chemotaxis protein